MTEPANSPAPQLLVELEPWLPAFLRNLRDEFSPQRLPPLTLSCRPATFWPDVFVSRPLPWRRFLESAVYHALVFGAVWGASQIAIGQPRSAAPKPFDSHDVIYYSASEYLPPLNTGVTAPTPPQAGGPAFSRQPIISVPGEADNRTQTIVTPPDIKLTHEVPLPNIVAWERPEMSIPLAATTRSTDQLHLPSLPATVVAPPPEVIQPQRALPVTLAAGVIAPPPEIQAESRRDPIQAPMPSIIEPPPSLDRAASTRRISDINIGHTEVVAPAPQLPMGEQRSMSSLDARTALGSTTPQVVPPPPAIQGTQLSNSGGRLIALGIRPANPSGPIVSPAGNRLGSFAATPEGKPSGAGTPSIAADPSHAGGNSARGAENSGASTGGAGTAPSGLFVGTPPGGSAAIRGTTSTGNSVAPENSVSPSLSAKATPPRVASVPRTTASPVSGLNATELEKKVFRNRRFYSLTLNMPNLNSAGGSWVIRFAELKDEVEKGELVAPEAMHKVDPAYPLALMRKNVAGTVTLYAVIHSDGSVGEVRVLQGVDDRLDEFARQALSQWRFRPATKNGSAVALDAVVMIPFRPARSTF